MTAFFKPPSAPGWQPTPGDLVRIGDAGDPFWRKVRAAQIDYVDRYLPWCIPIAIINAAIVLATLLIHVDLWSMALLVGSQALAICTGATRAYAGRNLPEPPPHGPAATRRILAEMLFAGIGWGVVFAQGIARADTDLAMLSVAMAMTGMVCMAFAAGIFPLAALALSGPVAVGTLVGLGLNGAPGLLTINIVLATFILFIARGTALSTFAFLRRLKAQEELDRHEQMIRLLLNEFETNGSEWLFEFDANGIVTFVSSRFAEITGTPVELVIGTNWKDGLTDDASVAPLIQTIDQGLPYRDHLLRLEVGGEPRWWSLSGTPKFDSDGRFAGYRGVGSDVTEQHNATERIAELATFDALTGLVNRRIIHQALADGLRSAEGVALLFVDLDRFKAVNDSLGHGAGDRLLAEVALRLRDSVAEGGGPRALAGRLGGDEFAVVLRGADQATAMSLGTAIIAALSRSYDLVGKQAMIGASVGLAMGPADGETVEALMRAADLALYDVKAKGRGSVRAYDRALHHRAEERRALELDLRGALGAGQLRLAFQPVVDAIDERIVGFEALMRWRHPAHGEVSPAVFIPIAEEAGLIGELGQWALNEACRTATQWPRHVKLAVNLSPLQFDDPGLAEGVRQTLVRWKIPPERLELELTESLFLDERAQTTETLGRLHAMGVGFALDDFGTGYSSLGYLQKIAFSRIKIDRSFVQASVADGGESTAIIQAIVALADRLGMETTAEGTETRAEFEAMRRLGCAQIQGYYFGRPMSGEDALRLIDRSRPLVRFADLPQPGEESTGEPISPPPPSLQATSGRWREAAAPTSPRLRPARHAPLRG